MNELLTIELSNEIEQLTNDYVFKFKNDEYIDSFDIARITRNYVIVRFVANNVYSHEKLNVQFMHKQLSNVLTLIKS